MKNNLLTLLFTIFTGIIFANTHPVNPTEHLAKKKQVITDQLFKLQEIDRILEEENLTYDQLATKYPDLLEATPVAPTVDEGVFDKAPDAPLGIPGFWWGFCLGFIGLLVIYIAMDEGKDRKEQIKYGLYGCVTGAIISIIIHIARNGLDWIGDSGSKVIGDIVASC